jgi:hypothetical protein
MPHGQPARLDSEEVALAAPMSFTGSAQRLWKLARGHANAWMSAAVLLLITLVWVNVPRWYAFFRLWLVPHRVIRPCSSGLQSARAFSGMSATSNSAFPPRRLRKIRTRSPQAT